MHMPPHPPLLPILGADAAERLWRVLAPERWPLPLEALPAGTALVGGAVRDGLLGRLAPRPDLDLVVPDEAVALCRHLASLHGGHAVVLDAQRSIARLVIRGWTIDLARQVGTNLEDDLGRRDFRLNALALPLRTGAALIDPTGGLGDLERRVLVAVSEANLLDDPLRLLRGVRLASQLGFLLEERTQGWIQRHHRLLQQVAPERVLVELEKLAACDEGHQGLRQALDSGLLAPWAVGGPAAWLEGLTPERAGVCGLSPEECASALPLARLASLFDATGLEKLRSSRRLQGRCGRLHHWQLRLGTTPKEAQETLAAMGEPERLALHRQLESDLPALALQLPPELAMTWMRRWRNADDPLFHPRPPLDGQTLQATFSLTASPRLGELLGHLTHERAFGRVNDGQGALQAAEQWLKRQTNPGGGASAVINC